MQGKGAEEKFTQALVIGTSGGIGECLARQIAESGQHAGVHAVSRFVPADPVDGVKYQVMPQQHEAAIARYCEMLKVDDQQFTLVICCIGSCCNILMLCMFRLPLTLLTGRVCHLAGESAMGWGKPK